MIENRDSLQDLLSSEEIDALLSPKEPSPPTIDTLVKSKEVFKEKSFPSFERHLDVFTRSLTTTLRHLTEGQDISVTLKNFITGQLGSYLKTIQSPALLGFFTDKNKNIPGLISIDPTLSYTLIDMALGGRRGTAAMQIGDRRYTQIEKTILEKFIKALLQNLQKAFQTSFIYEGIDTNPQTALIEATSTEMLISRLDSRIDRRNGLFDIVFPRPAIDQLEQETEKLDNTDVLRQTWNQKLELSVSEVSLEIDAVLDQKIVPFKSILNWKTGETLPFSIFEGKPIQLMCENVPLFQGRVDPHQKNIQIILDKSSGKEPSWK